MSIQFGAAPGTWTQRTPEQALLSSQRTVARIGKLASTEFEERVAAELAKLHNMQVASFRASDLLHGHRGDEYVSTVGNAGRVINSHS
jgi:hypothetical protein